MTEVTLFIIIRHYLLQLFLELLLVCLITSERLKPIIDIFVSLHSKSRWGYLSLQVEAELTELPVEERQEYLQSLGVSESGLGNLIRATYDLLGLRTYFTSGEKVRGKLEFFLEIIQLEYPIKHV